MNPADQPTLVLAFYKGRIRFLDRLIQWWTGSPYSHVELFDLAMTPDQARVVVASFNRSGPDCWLEKPCWSASWRDGGVRLKTIRMEPARWTLVLAGAGMEAYQAYETFHAHWGKPYDWPGLIRTQVFKLRAGPAWKRRWFCSEIVAHALGLPDPWQFSPGSLFERVSQMNAACTKLTAIKAANLRPVAASEPEAFQ